MPHNRIHIHVAVADHLLFKSKLLDFYKHTPYFVLLDSNEHSDCYSNQQWLAAAGNLAHLEVAQGHTLDKLRDFYHTHRDWLFGFLSYDIKNELEQLHSHHFDCCEAPLMHFFVPEVIFKATPSGVEVAVHAHETATVTGLIQCIVNHRVAHAPSTPKSAALTPVDTPQAYVEKVQKMKQHIMRGDIYEANFCTQFQALQVGLDTVKAFNELNALSKSPFAAFARLADLAILSASPERYIRKEGNQIISQPIKGTAGRSAVEHDDLLSKTQLAADPKERSENVMIVDLVRNDLSKIAVKGSVQVAGLFEIYSFKQVHQMISTITAQLAPSFDFIDVLKATFPMGSMTGAPKVSAMHIIEQLESFKRGVYSGALGYITPAGDMDFNVVIRSIIYNHHNHNVSVSVGSAITAQAQPEREYAECLLKAQALLEVLATQGIQIKSLEPC